MKLRISAIFFLAPVLAFAKVQTENASQVKSSLSKVQKQIQKLEKTVYHSQHQEKVLMQHLSSIEKEIGEKSEQLREHESKMQKHRTALNRLQKEEQQYAQSHQKHQDALAKLLQTTYQHQDKEKLKMMLAPKEWSSLARVNHYYHYFYNARAHHINSLSSHLKQIQTIKDNIVLEQNEIQTVAHQIRQSQVGLEEKKEKRKEVLSAISKELTKANSKLSQLQQQEQHLAQLFKMLQKKLAQSPSYVEPTNEFAKMKHKLELPIQADNAKLSVLAQVSKASKSASKKTYIDAAMGTPVHSIFGGRVVFSEWLRGIGLLLIVDHGNGYMSLYGNNQKLYKSLGDWVDKGEMIARVGQSGGHTEPGLYFEIRKNGEALDPTPWFKQA